MIADYIFKALKNIWPTYSRILFAVSEIFISNFCVKKE